MLGPLIAAGATLAGSYLSSQSSEANAERNIAMQREFAQNGIRWRVEDARAAGIHPLYAMGAQTHSFAPVSVGNSMGPALASMGQDVGRAINATQTAPERMNATAEAASKLQLENMSLQNMLLASRVKLLNQSGGNPPIPSIGALPPIPEDTKQDARPPLQMGGDRIQTDPGTTNMQKFEDRYGDEGPVPWVLQTGVAFNDLVKNYGQPATWPTQIMGQLWRRLSDEAREEAGNFKNFVSKLRRSDPQGGGGW